MTDHYLRDALGALSLANLSLLGVWNAVLNTPRDQTFFLEQSPAPAQYAAAMANVFLIGLVMFVVIRLARLVKDRYGFLVASPILLLLALPAARAVLRIVVTNFHVLGLRGWIVAFALLSCAAALVARRKTFALGAAVLVTVSPLIPIEAGLSVSQLRAADAAEYAGGPLAPLSPHGPRPRVVWIIFDELDYRLSFPERPSNLALPEFDRLRAESIFAQHALPPGDNTLYSINSLLTGEHLKSIAPLDSSHAIANGTPLTAGRTIFSDVHAMGRNAAVDGWYLPYCRLFSADLAACSWHGIETSLSITRGSFAEALVRQEQSLFEYGYITIFPQSLRAKRRVRLIHAMSEESRRYAADPALDFVFLHLAAPHPPHYYDRFSRTFTKRNAGAEGYADSLALADRMLGEIRQAMTSAGLWDKTTVLVSSDHAYRDAIDFDGKMDPRVPFLLKLAGQTADVPYAAPLQTIVTKPLLEAILACQVASPEEAVKWLQTH